jgi:hypothetical protein
MDQGICRSISGAAGRSLAKLGTLKKETTLLYSKMVIAHQGEKCGANQRKKSIFLVYRQAIVYSYL